MVIVLSVAMLPVAGFATPVIGSAVQDPSEAEAEAAKMMTSSETPAAMQDCCPDEANGQPCDHSSDQCPMACCSALTVNIASPAVFQFDPPLLLANPLPVPDDQVVSLHSRSPPFRPPRV